jgi:cytochrome P450
VPGTAGFRSARAELDAVLRSLIAEHRAGGDRGDILSIIIDVDEGRGGGGRRISDVELRDEAATLLQAGGETSAQALTWTWYLLARHPSVAADLHRQIDALGGRLPVREDLATVPWARMVAAESMRLYPPVWGVDRVAPEDVEIGGCRFGAGSTLWVSQYVVQRDARWFEDPLAFRPERWTPEAEALRPHHSYFPFGAGLRQCYGEPFAWMMSAIVLVVLGARWAFDLAPGHEVRTQPTVLLFARGGMPMIPRRREGRSG